MSVGDPMIVHLQEVTDTLRVPEVLQYQTFSDFI